MDGTIKPGRRICPRKRGQLCKFTLKVEVQYEVFEQTFSEANRSPRGTKPTKESAENVEEKPGLMEQDETVNCTIKGPPLARQGVSLPGASGGAQD